MIIIKPVGAEKDTRIDPPISVPSPSEFRHFVNMLCGRNYVIISDGQICEVTHIRTDARLIGDEYERMHLGFVISLYPTGFSEARRCISIKELWRMFHEGIAGKFAKFADDELVNEMIKKQKDYVDKEMRA